MDTLGCPEAGVAETRPVSSALTGLDSRDPHDHVAPVFAGPSHRPELLHPHPLDTDEVAPLRVTLGFVAHVAERHGRI